ncbi:hypothetical protein RRG08_066735, partial [Elysia crispata]
MIQVQVSQRPYDPGPSLSASPWSNPGFSVSSRSMSSSLSILVVQVSQRPVVQ